MPKKALRVLPIFALFLYIFSPLYNISPSYAKGGEFQIESITDDGFGQSSIFDFNDALEFDGNLYVTTDTDTQGRVYRSDTGDADDWALTATAGFGDVNNSAIDAMSEFESNLYITSANDVDGAEIWRSANGTDWTAVVGGGAGVGNGFGDANNVIVRESCVFDDTGLADQYLWGFADNATDGVESWRSTNGTVWAQSTMPALTLSSSAYVSECFEYASRLYIYVIDNDAIELWYTTGGAVPVWVQVGIAAGTETFLDVIDTASDISFAQYGGDLYVGASNTTDSEIWVSEDGDVFTLSVTYNDLNTVYPVTTSKGLIAVATEISLVGGLPTGVIRDMRNGLIKPNLAFAYTADVFFYRYTGAAWVFTGINTTLSDFVPMGGREFGDYYYAYGAIPGKIIRVDMRPTVSAPISAQTQEGDGIVWITFNAGDLMDSDSLRAKIEYDIGGGYQKATLSESDGDIYATYGTPDIENDNEYQVGNAGGWITTSTGVNLVTVKWPSKIDEPIASTANANIRVSVSDGVTSGDQKVETPVIIDNVDPTVVDVNVAEGQSVTTNPFILKTKITDAAAGVWKVLFYVDGTLLCTDTTADANGRYECGWDTSEYQSDVRIIAYDNVGNTTERNYDTNVYLAGTGDNLYVITGMGLALLLPLPVIIVAGVNKIKRPAHA